jgi:hypothetical protein
MAETPTAVLESPVDDATLATHGDAGDGQHAEPEWVIRDHVPIYDAHELEFRNPKTGNIVSIPVDEKRLKAIVDKANAKISRTGDESPIIVGHTRNGTAEHEQPPIVGYADRFRVGPHPDDNRPTIYCRYKLYPTSQVGDEQLSADEIMRRFPRRSPEVWLSNNDIDAISLLGPTTPARYLGLLRNQRSGQPVRYGASAMNPEALTQALVAAIQPIIAQMCGGGAPSGAAPAGDTGMPPDGGPAQYAAGCAGANATYTPTLEKVRMAREQAAIASNQHDSDNKRRDAEIADLRLKYQRSVRERDLIQLEAEGYRFDRAEELVALEAMPDEMYVQALARIKKNYQRTAGGDFIRTARTMEGGGKPNCTRDHAERAAKMALSSGKPYEECLQTVLSGAA